MTTSKLGWESLFLSGGFPSQSAALTTLNDVRRVSVLLGHTSIKVTEKHYSPWVRERQEQAEADVRRTWDRDPVAVFEMKGTPEVHQ